MSEQDNDFREIIDASSDEEIKVEDENKEKDEYEDICYICRRPESVAGKMIHIPTDICICNDCMQKTFDSMGSFGFGGGDNANLNNVDLTKMPNISMINLSDLGGFMPNMPNSQKLKKKKPKEKKDVFKRF